MVSVFAWRICPWHADNAGNPYTSRGTESCRICSLLIKVLNQHHSDSAISLAALRALNNVADAVVALADLVPGVDDALAPALYSKNGMESLCAILQDRNRSVVSAKRTELAARLLAQTSCHESQRATAEASGVMEALIGCLDEFLPQGHMQRCTAFANGSQPVSGRVPAVNLRLSLLLQAIATIVEGSVQRARSCLESFSIHINMGASASRLSSGTYSAARDTNWAITPQRNMYNPSNTQLEQQATSLITSQPLTQSDRQDDREGSTALGPVLEWLLSLVQNSDTPVRLMSIWITVLLMRSDRSLRLSGKGIVKSFIPMLVQMMQPLPDLEKTKSTGEEKDARTIMRLKVVEDAPAS